MRRLVICADGTWNDGGDDDDQGPETPTNVVKLARAVLPVASDGTSQITYYHTGLGTHDDVDRVLGGAFGEGLVTAILDCYRFLVNNYAPGDELYFFGFSRGAYTVRSLAGLIRNSGLLRLEHAGMEGEAFSLYRDRDPDKHPNSDTARAFREQYAWDVGIRCVGVWDTVGALGIPVTLFKKFTHRRHAFHDVTLSSRIENAFHALAIDERRKPFAPTLWEQPTADLFKTWLEQAWFAGVHSNVGGGYPDAGLSDQSFRWMVGRVKARCGLEFNEAYVERVTRPSVTGRLYDSMNEFYRGLGEFERQIDEAAAANAARGVSTWEYVHESVKHRLDQAPATGDRYAPPNLRRYLDRTDPRPLVLQELLAVMRDAEGREPPTLRG
jgi:uncharacterized protein (DUF2235 family)